MILFGVFLYWLIGQIVIVKFWTKDLNYTLDIALLIAIGGWMIWPGVAIVMIYQKFNLPGADYVIIPKKTTKDNE